jgi:hypothetical protein
MLHWGNLKRFLNEEALPDREFNLARLLFGEVIPPRRERAKNPIHIETSAESGLEPRQEKGYFVRYPLSLLAISVQDKGTFVLPILT